MMRRAFKMKLKAGCEQEYKDRHDRIWPELRKLLKDAGISDYAIYLDPETNNLFAVQKVEDPEKLKSLPEDPVMRKWWDHMAGIMETHPDHAPVEVGLQEMFYMD